MPGPLQRNAWSRTASCQNLEDISDIDVYDAKTLIPSCGARSHDFPLYDSDILSPFENAVVDRQCAAACRSKWSVRPSVRVSAEGNPGSRVVGFDTSFSQRDTYEIPISRSSENLSTDDVEPGVSSPLSELLTDSHANSSRALCLLPYQEERMLWDFSGTRNLLGSTESVSPAPPSSSDLLSPSARAQSQALPIPMSRTPSPSQSYQSSVSPDSILKSPLSISPISPRFIRRSSPLGRSPPSTCYFSPCNGLRESTSLSPSASTAVYFPGTTSNARSLAGSFEECLITGRLASTARSRSVGGFMAVLAVQAGCGSPAKRRLPFTAMYFPDFGRQAPPYFAYIHLDGKGGATQEDQERGPPRPTKAASRYRVPKKGQLQLVLSNPEGTPVHTFLASYDLEHLRPRSKTFLRQKTTAFPKQTKQMANEEDGFLETQRTLNCTEVGKKVKCGSLRYAMQVRFACLPAKRSSKINVGNELEDAEESRLYIYECIRVIFAHQQADSESEFLHTETCPCGDGLLSDETES